MSAAFPTGAPPDDHHPTAAVALAAERRWAIIVGIIVVSMIPVAVAWFRGRR